MRVLIGRMVVAGALACGGVAVMGAGAPASGAEVVVQLSDARYGGGCVSRAEYRRVHDGMRKTRVHRIFGTEGERDSLVQEGGDTYEVRHYFGCRDHDVAAVQYKNKKVIGKSKSW